MISNAYELEGPALREIIANRGDTGVRRPYRGRDGRTYIDKIVNFDTGERKAFVTNAPGSLPRETWMAIDETVLSAFVEELTAFADVRANTTPYRLPNGLAHTMLLSQVAGDMRPATVSMGTERRSEADMGGFSDVVMPLPVVHKDWDIPYRMMLAMESAGLPLDVSPAEQAARKVAEEIEHLLVGTTQLANGTHAVAPAYMAMGGGVYGFLNFPNRINKFSLTAPTGTNGDVVIGEILGMRQSLYNAGHKGPFIMYVNKQWPTFLDRDYSTTKGENTLRSRILESSDITEVKTLDSLPEANWWVVIQEMQTRSIRSIVGMEIETVSWTTNGDYGINHFKTIALLLAQLRPNSKGTSGTAVGTSLAS